MDVPTQTRSPQRAANRDDNETSRSLEKPLTRGAQAARRQPDSWSAGSNAEGQKPPQAAELLPSVSLPKSGGAIRGLGEKFTVNAATGTSSLVLPLPFSLARFTPQLQLTYDSGSGNGPFGFGWSLQSSSITRKTDKGLPRYCDGAESDTFILANAEDLVPILDGTGVRKHLTRTVHGTAYRIYLYRPRVEGQFARIERWLALDTGITHWRTISRDNVSTLFGFDATSRIADPADARKIFRWNISRSWDKKGNLILYGYTAEDGSGINFAAAHEVNRTAAGRAVQEYLTTVRYGNLEAYVADWSAAGNETALPVDWAFSMVLDYGDHASTGPTPAPDRAWPLRPDPFSTYRSGFEIRTYRRVQRVLFFDNFPQETAVGANSLVRSLDLLYSDQQAPADPRNPLYTFLVSATETGYQ